MVLLNVITIHISKILKMGNNYKLYFMTVPSTTLRHLNISLRHRSAMRWLSVAETTVDKERTKISKAIKYLI